jgi:hypothetical protein
MIVCKPERKTDVAIYAGHPGLVPCLESDTPGPREEQETGLLGLVTITTTFPPTGVAPRKVWT